MPNALGICGTMYKVKKEENLFWGELWLPSQNARTRVRLLYENPIPTNAEEWNKLPSEIPNSNK